jgi:hypothetical protein
MTVEIYFGSCHPRMPLCMSPVFSLYSAHEANMYSSCISSIWLPWCIQEATESHLVTRCPTRMMGSTRNIIASILNTNHDRCLFSRHTGMSVGPMRTQQVHIIAVVLLFDAVPSARAGSIEPFSLLLKRETLQFYFIQSKRF